MLLVCKEMKLRAKTMGISQSTLQKRLNLKRNQAKQIMGILLRIKNLTIERHHRFDPAETGNGKKKKRQAECPVTSVQREAPWADRSACCLAACQPDTTVSLGRRELSGPNS